MSFTIHLDDYSSTKSEEVMLPVDTPGHERTILITCTMLCILRNQFTFQSKILVRNLIVSFENVQFENTIIVVQNFNVHFVRVVFVNSQIVDTFPRVGELGEIMLTFTQVSFSQLYQGFYGCGLSIKTSYTVSIRANFSQFLHTCVEVSAHNLWFHAENSLFLKSQIDLAIPLLCIATFHNVSLEGWDQWDESAALVVKGTKLKMNFEASKVENNSGGILVVKQDSGLMQSWMQLEVTNSHFASNRKRGSGGAVGMLFFPPKKQISGTCFFHVYGCSFVDNRVERKGSSNSYAGAIYVKSPTSTATADLERSTLIMSVKNCHFVNNQAEDEGGSIFVSEHHIDFKLFNSQFLVDSQQVVTLTGTFLVSASKSHIQNSTFNFPVKNSQTPLVKLHPPQEDRIEHLDMSINCPHWHKLISKGPIIKPDLDEKISLQNAELFCYSCPATFYVPTTGSFHVSYKKGQKDIEVLSSNSFGDLECSLCPDGGDCPGHTIVAKPNFWGYEADAGILFYQCPLKYCCSATTDNPCDGYDLCSGNRRGTLCGACKEGHSLSMLSDSCVQNSSCSDKWLWGVTILAIIGYMLWYMFKEDILSFPWKFVKQIFQITHNGDTDVDKGYFGILIYFSQTAALLRLSTYQASENRFHTLMQNIEMYLGILLNAELANQYVDICAEEDVTFTDKIRFKMLFLLGIFISWGTCFVCLLLATKLVIRLCKKTIFNNAKNTATFLSGLVEIIKYTYGGFSSIVFTSLACVTIAGNKVWYFDATVQCFSTWQVSMILFGVLYIIPYPFMLYTGMKLLKSGIVSSNAFLAGSFFPFPFPIFWAIQSFKMKYCLTPVENISSGNTLKMKVEGREMFDRFRGGYKDNGSGAEYWESVMILRRLLLSATALVPGSLIQLTICFIFCVTFLVHHILIQPFEYPVSNQVETLSLSSLCLVSVINIIKSMHVYQGSASSDSELVSALGLIEIMLIQILILCIICLEVKFRRKKNN